MPCLMKRNDRNRVASTRARVSPIGWSFGNLTAALTVHKQSDEIAFHIVLAESAEEALPPTLDVVDAKNLHHGTPAPVSLFERHLRCRLQGFGDGVGIIWVGDDCRVQFVGRAREGREDENVGIAGILGFCDATYFFAARFIPSRNGVTSATRLRRRKPQSERREVSPLLPDRTQRLDFTSTMRRH